MKVGSSVDLISAIKAFQNISSGNKINRASDDAAGLAISQTMTAQSKGYEQGIKNVQSAKDALSTAESALGSIGESLGRMRELGVQAKSSILTDDERSIIQQEITAIKSDIVDTVKNSQFNTKTLLDGSFRDIAVGTGSNNGSIKVGVADNSLKELGIENFDVTSNFDLGSVDAAIKQVSGSRAEIGAQSNRLESAISSFQVAQENTEAAFSQLAGADIAQEMTNLNQSNLIRRYQLQMQQQQQKSQSSIVDLLT